MKKLNDTALKGILEIISGNLMMFLWPTIMILIFGSSIFMVIIPKITEISDLNSKRVTNEVATKLNNDKRNYLLGIDQESLQKNSDLLGRSIIKEKDAYFLVNVLRKVMDDYSFQIQSFLINPGELKSGVEVKKLTADSTVSKIPVQLTITGPKSKYVEMLLGIEHSLPIFSLDRMNLTSLNDVVKLDMVVSSYYIANKNDIKIDNLTLADLTLKKDEQDLVDTISTFTPVVLSNNAGLINGGQSVNYNRVDPFSF